MYSVECAERGRKVDWPQGPAAPQNKFRRVLHVNWSITPKIHSQGYWIKKINRWLSRQYPLNGEVYDSRRLHCFSPRAQRMQRACWHENCFLPKRHNALAKLIPDWIVNWHAEYSSFNVLIFAAWRNMRAWITVCVQTQRSINSHGGRHRKVNAAFGKIHTPRETLSVSTQWGSDERFLLWVTGAHIADFI